MFDIDYLTKYFDADIEGGRYHLVNWVVFTTLLLNGRAPDAYQTHGSTAPLSFSPGQTRVGVTLEQPRCSTSLGDATRPV